MDVLLLFLCFFPILSAVLFVRLFSYFSYGGVSRENKMQRKNYPPTLPHYSFPIFGHLHLLGQPLHRSLAAFSTQHGPLLSLRLGSRPTIVVSSPSLADHCLTKHDVTFADRPRVLAGQLLGYNYSNMASAAYGAHWRNLRRIAAIQLLSSHRIQALFAIPAEEVGLLLKCLFFDWKAGKSVVELKSRLSEVTFNAMMRMIAAEVVDLEESKLFRRLDKLFDELAVSYLGDFVPVLGWVDYGGVAKRMKRLAGEMDEFLQGLVDKQRQKKILRNDDDRLPLTVDDRGDSMINSKKETLIEVLLSLQETDPEYYTDNIIKGFIGVSGCIYIYYM